MSRILSTLALTFVVAVPIGAQQTTAPTPQAARTDSSAAAKAATPEALELAGRLLKLMNIEETVRAGTELAFDTQVQQNPLMAPFRPTMQAWVNKYFTYDMLAPKFTEIYAEEFSVDELKALITFYQSPVGRKVATLTPKLSRRGGEVGATLAQEHMGELQQMIQARAAELEKQGAPPAKP